MAKPLRYDAYLRIRMTKEQFEFLKEYAARYDTEMSQLVRDYIGKLQRSERRCGRREGTR